MLRTHSDVQDIVDAGLPLLVQVIKQGLEECPETVTRFHEPTEVLQHQTQIMEGLAVIVTSVQGVGVLEQLGGVVVTDVCSTEREDGQQY